MMAGLARHKGMPAARLAVLGSGLVLAAAVFMIIPGVRADLAALLLFVFLVPAALVIHNFRTEPDPNITIMEKLHFSKDFSFDCACLVFFGLLSSADSVRLFLTDPFFS